MSEEADVSTSLGQVPDLKNKLEWLIRNRGGFDDTRARVTSQKGLARALRVDESQITRWKQLGRIPDLPRVAPQISQVFGVDESSFRRDTFQAFVNKTLGDGVTWEKLIVDAEVAGIIEAVQPLGGLTHVHRHAGPADDNFEGENVPIYQPGTPIKVAFSTTEGNLSFTGWHVLAFSRDRDGYLSWIPRYSNNPAFRGLDIVASRFGSIEMPALGGSLKVGDHAHGHHDVVLVLSKEPYRHDFMSELAAPVQPCELIPCLDRLAIWLAPRLVQDLAKVFRRPYFVGAP